MWKNYFLGIESPKQRKVARDRAAEGEEGRGSLEWHKKEPLEEQVVIEIGQDAFMENKIVKGGISSKAQGKQHWSQPV